MMDTKEAVASYLAGPQMLRQAVAGVGRNQLIARPIPGKWSVLEVVAHLADVEVNIAHRLKKVLAEDRPGFDRFEHDRFLAALSYNSRHVDDELAIIELTRRQIARILDGSPPEAWERAGIVNGRGPRTLTQMLRGAVEHLEHHLSFIAEKREVLRDDSGMANM